MAIWNDQWRASLPSADEPPGYPSAEVPTPPSGEVSTIPPPPPEDDLMVRIDESDGSGDDVERIKNLDRVIRYQEAGWERITLWSQQIPGGRPREDYSVKPADTRGPAWRGLLC